MTNAQPTPSPRPPKENPNLVAWPQRERSFYLFILPWIIGFVLFDAGAIIASFGISFTNWSALSAQHMLDLNYSHLVADPIFYKAMGNSLYYGLGSVGLGTIVSFLLALLLNQNVWGMSLFRTIFYLPSVSQWDCGGDFVDYDSPPRFRVD
jgi:multiple sugar transport system permease protein